MKKTIFAVMIFAVFAFAGNRHYRGIVDFTFDVAKGRVSGHTAVSVAGENPTVLTTTDPEDVWGGGGIYAFYPDTAENMELYCDSSADSIGGTGALTVEVTGLDSNWAEIKDTVTATGTAAAALSIQYIRMYRAKVLTAGSGEVNDGAISIWTAADSTVGAYIAAGDGQAQQAVYTVPADKSAYIVKNYAGVSGTGNAASAKFKLKTRRNDISNGAWQVKGQPEAINDASSWLQFSYGFPLGSFSEKTDIRLEVNEVTDTLGVVGGFDLLLVDD